MCQDAQELLHNDLPAFARCCNGVGSTIGWIGWLTYHFIPDTIWGADFTSVSDIHDVEYCYPKRFTNIDKALQHKKESDKRLLRNGIRLMYSATLPCSIHYSNKEMKELSTFLDAPERLLLAARLHRVRAYYFIVDRVGSESFLKGKTFFADGRGAI